MILTDNLISYWKLDESSGNATDIHGGNTLSNQGSMTYTTGKLSNGANLATTADATYLNSSSSTGLNVTGDFSVSFWIKAAATPGANPGLFNKGSNGGIAGYQFWRGEDGTITMRWGPDPSGAQVLKSTTVAVDDAVNFHHIVIAYRASAGEVDVYKDGSLGQTVTGMPTSVKDSSQVFEIGGNQGGDVNYGNGVIDEFGFWSRALTSTEAALLYNNGNGRGYPFSLGNFLAFL